jgi:hypothetical protein
MDTSFLFLAVAMFVVVIANLVLSVLVGHKTTVIPTEGEGSVDDIFVYEPYYLDYYFIGY